MKDKINEIIMTELVITDPISDDDKFVDDLGADSWDANIIMEIEDHFDIKVIDEDVDKVVTVADAHRLVAECINKD